MRRFAASLVAFDAAEVADEKQVLEMPAHGGAAFVVLDCLLPASLAPRPERRADDLLEQRRLAVGRAPEDPQVSPRDAEPRQLGGRAHDLEVGLVVDVPPVLALGLDDAVLLELPEEPVRDARLVEQ